MGFNASAYNLDYSCFYFELSFEVFKEINDLILIVYHITLLILGK